MTEAFLPDDFGGMVDSSSFLGSTLISRETMRQTTLRKCDF